jgi:ATP-dependent Clp protease adaptor protein ClpS
VAARLDPNTTLALAEARSLARRHHHAEADVEHLLLALFTQRDGLLTIEGVSRPELVGRLEARIAARPRAALYRDTVPVVDPPLSASAETALQRAASGRGLAFFRAVNRHDLFVALVTDPTLAPLVAESRIADYELDDLLDQASTLAASRQHASVTVAHVLLAMVDAEWFAAALHAAAADPELLRERLEASVISVPRARPGRRGGRSSELDDIVRLSKLRASTAGHAIASGRHFIFTVAQDLGVARAFADAGVQLPPLLRHLSSGHADPGEDAPGEEGDLAIVFHDDDWTTMEFVVGLLTQVFGLSPALATKVTFSVNSGEERVIGTLDAEEARTRVATARVRADEASMPLRISLRRR